MTDRVQTSNATRTRLLAWVAILVAAVGLLTVASVDQGGRETDGERIQRLSASFACPECRGQSVSDSNAAVAVNIRDFIADEVAAGSSDEEIRDQLVAAYDASVLLNPPASGIATLVWVLPVVLVMLGAVALAAAVTRNRGATRAVTDDDAGLVEQARERTRARTGDRS
jgi:cytochrome c-type biogenesis protein CcmH